MGLPTQPLAARGGTPVVVLAQLSHPLNDRNHYFCNKENLPLAAGYLKAMARARGLERVARISILEPELSDFAGDAAVVAALAEREVDVLGLSLYPWNFARSLALARDLRAHRPGLVVVTGGPETNPAKIPELLARRGVDVAIPGEGEVTFSETLRVLLEGGDLGSVAGVCFLEDGAVVTTPPRPTLADLDEIPSPLLEGDIDARRYHGVHVLFERGCVYSCKFCHWWPDRRSRGRFSLERLEREMLFLRAAGVKEVVLLDAAINASRHFEAVCDVLERTNRDGRLEVKVQVLFDHFTRDQLERLSRGGVRRIEIGLQSADPEVLRKAQRPTELSRLAEALSFSDGLPLELQVDFILGLPGGTVATVEKTAELIRETTRGRRLAQVSPFVLSVGSASRLYREGPGLGLRFQPEPPHRVLGLPEMDYAALRALRQRIPALLGCSELPGYELDRPHYALNFFEPELADSSSPHPEPASRHGATADSTLAQACWPSDAGLLDAVRIVCDRTSPGHAHPFDPAPVASRLNQIAQVWFDVARPEACEAHMADTLATLARPNPYTVWDVVVETADAFDLYLLDRLEMAISYEVNNLDWDNYLVNRDEGPGWARVATRLILVLPLGSAGASWLARASRRAALVHAIQLGGSLAGSGVVARAAALPGEGVLVDLAPGCGAAGARAAIEELAALDTRVRGARNLVLKALAETRRAARLRQPRPRVPYRDRQLLFVNGDGSARVAALTRRQLLLDLAEIGPRLAPRPATAVS